MKSKGPIIDLQNGVLSERQSLASSFCFRSVRTHLLHATRGPLE
jgi:hypothetical protein